MGAKRVLIVDDDETFRLIAREALMKKGYVAQEAANGAEAQEAVKQSAPDMLLVDIMMPGQDGVALCRELRTIPGMAGVPILVVTALSDSRVLQDAMRFGADDYLLKPVDASVLRAKVEKMLAKASAH